MIGNLDNEKVVEIQIMNLGLTYLLTYYMELNTTREATRC
jgi:hypothetical protein